MSRRRPPKISGLLPVIKATGPTSHDVVDKARRALKERRIGHTGTLDPMAEGLLLLCVGHATRLQQYLLGWPKTYHGIVRLGFATTTYDREGDATDPRGQAPELDRETLAGIEQRFDGTFDQLAASLQRIASRVGVSKGSLYYYFDDKADLFSTVADHAWELFLPGAEVDLSIFTETNYWAVLSEYMRETRARVREHPWLVGFTRMIYNPPAVPEIERSMAERFAEARELQRIFGRHGDATKRRSPAWLTTCSRLIQCRSPSTAQMRGSVCRRW